MAALTVSANFKDGVTPGLKKVSTAIKGFKAPNMLDVMGGVLGAGAVTGLFSGLTNGVQQLASTVQSQLGQSVQKAMQFETTQISLEVMLGGKEEADKMIADLRALSDITPFTFADVSQAMSTLVGFGVETKGVVNILDRLTSIAGGSSEKLQRIALAFGQISAAGRLMGQDNLQLINAGFNPLQQISIRTGESMMELKKRMEAGGISADEVKQAFIDVTSEGGRFAGMNKRISQTTTGLLSTLDEVYTQIQIAFGTPINDAIRPWIAQVIGLLRSMKGEAEAMGAALGSVLNSVSSTLTDIIDSTDWSKGIPQAIGSIIVPVADIVKSALVSAMMSAANALMEGLRKAALAFGPLLGAIIKGMADGLIGMIRGVLDAIKSVIDPLKGMWGPLGDSAKAASKAINDASINLRNAGEDFDPAKTIKQFGENQTPIFSADAIKEQNDRTQKLINDLTKNDRLAGKQEERNYRRNREEKLAARKAEREFGTGEARPWWQVEGKTGEFSAALEAEVQRRRGAIAAGPEKLKTTAEMMGQPSPRELFSGAAKVKAAPQKSGFATMAESIAWISGRTVNDLMLEQNVKQTDVQQQMKDALDRIEKNTSNPKPVKVEIPQGAVFARP